jgi:D-serine deaminase-like pyridoxal phosphate-dependent protein
MDRTTLPSIEKFSGLMQLFNPNKEKSYYIYGGSWMALPYQPTGIEYSSFFGTSTNQVMLNSSSDTNLEVDDFVFFRPTQSEFVFLQFGNIICVRAGQIENEWDILRNEH